MEGKMEEFLSFRRIRILRIRLFIHSLPHWLGDFFVSALFLYGVPFLSI